ncbi:MAG: hypothetical protein WD690_16670 [Vicinamibacterales bacterium]
MLACAARAEETAEDVAAVATDHDGEAAFGKHHRHTLGEQVRVPHNLRLVAHAPGPADEVAVRLGKHVARVAGDECVAEPQLSQRGRRSVDMTDGAVGVWLDADAAGRADQGQVSIHVFKTTTLP